MKTESSGPEAPIFLLVRQEENLEPPVSRRKLRVSFLRVKKKTRSLQVSEPRAAPAMNCINYELYRDPRLDDGILESNGHEAPSFLLDAHMGLRVGQPGDGPC